MTTPGSSLPVCPPNPEYLAFGPEVTDIQKQTGFTDCGGRGVRIVYLCSYNVDMCSGDDRGAYEAVFTVGSDRYAGWLSCSPVETIPYWNTRKLNSSCGWVFKLKQTTARALGATAPVSGVPPSRYGHGFWFERSPFDPSLYPAVRWITADKDDSYDFHNFGGAPPGPRFARMFTACANP